MKKNIGAMISLGIFLVGFIIMIGKIQAQNEINQTRTDKLEEKTEEVAEEINDNEKIDVEQTTTLKYIQQTLEALNRKIDRGE